MRNDIRIQYDHILNESHYGQPSVVGVLRTGRRGRPRLVFDPQFLQWAQQHRTTSGISTFLSVGRSAVRNALLEHGLAAPGTYPFSTSNSTSMEPTIESPNFAEDDLLEPNLSVPDAIPADVAGSGCSTAAISSITDEDLDILLQRLRTHFRGAGIAMLDGLLRCLGQRIQRERIRASLLRIDPVRRVFERICIRCRIYSVPGPNALWHHDGQHGEFYS